MAEASVPCSGEIQIRIRLPTSQLRSWFDGDSGRNRPYDPHWPGLGAHGKIWAEAKTWEIGGGGRVEREEEKGRGREPTFAEH